MAHSQPAAPRSGRTWSTDPGQAVRWCILGRQSGLYLPGLAASAIVAGFFLWVGIHQFRKMERSFADII
jgi:hypothetical protein